MKKSLFILGLVVVGMLFVSNVSAQQIIVKGWVMFSDSQGPPYSGEPGVTVHELGTTNATTTNFDGYYSITVTSSKSVLVYSFIGYMPQHYIVENKRTINVILIPDMR